MIADIAFIHQQMFSLIVPYLHKHCLQDFTKTYTCKTANFEEPELNL